MRNEKITFDQVEIRKHSKKILLINIFWLILLAVIVSWVSYSYGYYSQLNGGNL